MANSNKKKSILDLITSIVIIPVKFAFRLVVLKPLNYLFGDTVKSINNAIKNSILGRVCSFISNSSVGKTIAKPYNYIRNFCGKIICISSKVIILILMLATVSYYFFLPYTIETLAPKGLSLLNIPTASLEVVSITSSTIKLSNIRGKNDCFTIESMRASFDKEKISDIAFENVVASGVVINGIESADGISFGELENMLLGIDTVEFEEQEDMHQISTIKRMYKRFSNFGIVIKTKEKIHNMAASAFVSFLGDKRAAIANISILDSRINIASDEAVKTIDFSFKGRLYKSGFSADIPIVVQSDSLNLASKLRINSRDDDIDVDFSVSEGNIRNDSINADEITGKVEVSIKDGVLKKAISNFVLASPEMKLTIDAKAQQIITMTSGTNKFDIPVSAGVYFYSIRSGNFQATKKMLYLK